MSKILAQGMITLTQLYEGAQVILTPSAVLIPCDSKEAPKPDAYINAFTNVRAFLGTMDITSKITLGTLEYSDSTVKASKTGTKVSITAITTRTGYVDIPVSVAIDGETIDLGKHRFSFVKQIDGQTGQTGAQGAPGFSYTLNIKGGTRGVAYAANGTNPEPKTSSQFSVELLKNGVKIDNPASISWTCGGNLSGSSSAATFTPTIKSTYNSESSYVKVSVKEFAASLAVEETIPIVCTKHADGLDWINEWNNQYVQVGTEKIITPKIFAGTKNNANELTGVAIGRDVLGGNANKVIGIVGYKNNTPVFSLDQDANFFVSSSGSAGDVKNGTNNAKGIYFDGNNLYVSGKVRISGGSTIGENNTSVEDVINNSNLGVQANNKLNNLSIGGRNLIRKADLAQNNSTATYDGATNTWTVNATAGGGGTWGCGLIVKNKNALVPYGKSYVLSFEIKVPRACSWNCDVNNYALTGSSWAGNDNDNGSKRATSSKSLVANQWIKCWIKWENTNPNNTNKVDIYDNSNFGVVMKDETSNMTYQIRNVKGELGNVPTEWTPAPEDVQADIDKKANSSDVYKKTETYTKTQTDSAIEVAKDEINLGVSSTYETKTNVESKISTANTTTLNSAKSYADTKKSEAITQAGKDADSKVATAKTELNGKIDGIEVGGRNLWIKSKTTGYSAIEKLGENHVTGQTECYRINNGGTLSFIIEPEFSSRLYRKVTFSAWVKYENVVKGENSWNKFNAFKHSMIRKNTSSGETTSQEFLTLDGFTGTSDWKFIQYTYDYSANKSYDQLKTGLRFNLEGTKSGTAWVTGIKVEFGNKVTAWTPAPEDVNSNIDTAKNEAINSANSTLTTTIANYYTKEQTNSQINIAKESINLGVSQTYETKANVESKISSANTSTLNSAKSYADTKKNEAISSASTDATSKVNSAKNELNTKINNLQVGGRNLVLNGAFINGASNWNSGVVFDNTITYKGNKTAKISQSGVTENKWTGIQQYGIDNRLIEGETYTIGAMYYVPDKSTLDSSIGLEIKGVKTGAGHEVLCATRINASDITNGKWFKLEKTFTAKGLSNYSSIYFYTWVQKNGTFYVTNCQMCQGNKLGEWTPAPEDVDFAINKKANSTDVYTKTEVYTKAETNSQINIAKDQINLGVSNTYETKANVESKVSSTLNSAKSYADTKKTEAINSAASDAANKVNSAKNELNTKINNIQVGGTNLVKGTQTFTGWTKGAGDFNEKYGNLTVFHNKFLASGGGYKDLQLSNAITPEPNTTYTLSYWAKGTGAIKNFFYPNCVASGIGSQGQKVTGSDGNVKFTLSSTWTRHWVTWTTTSNVSGIKNLIASRQESADSEVWLCGVKLEKGNKATDWSPAPEDTTADINTAKNEAINSANSTLTTTIANYYTKAQTDSQINVAKDAINLGVSNTYETKANVETKVSSTLNSAKSYADTKKNEAINSASNDATNKANNALNSAKSYADTKKNEAISSANNTLNSTIANYYTKTQTDSAIKVAKDEINLGVSNTYETKTNVETKINGISVGGTNLAYDTNKGATGWGWGIQTNGGKTITDHLADGIKGVKMVKDGTAGSGWNYVSYGRFKRDKITPATTYVVSFEMKSNLTFNVGSVNLMNGNSSDSLLKSSTAVQNKVTANSKAWNKIVFKLTTLDTLPSSTAQVIYITGIPYSANATHYFRNLKLEVGNTATAWSPAPEDTATDIATAKTEAINTASSDATSKVNSAKSELNTAIDKKANSADVYKKSETYTKSETDSKISVAKNDITLSVSNTYETKSNVETKVNNAVNNIQVGGRNLALKTSNNYSTAYSNFNGSTNTCPALAKVLTDGLKVGDTVTVRLLYKYTNIVATSGQTAKCWIQGNGNVTAWNSGAFHSSPQKAISGSGEHEFKYSFTVIADHLKNEFWSTSIRHDYVQSGSVQWKLLKIEKGNKATDWTPAPEDISDSINSKANSSDVYKKTEVYTKAETNSQINVAKDNITSSVSQNYLSKSDATNTYATKSSLTQTANSITAKFEASGGYNLIKNSSGVCNSAAMWTCSGGATLGCGVNTGIGSNVTQFLYLDNGTNTSEKFAFSSRFKLKPNTKYTFTGYFHNYTKCPNFDVFVLSSTEVGETNTGTGYTHVHQLISVQNTGGTWKKYKVTFTTPDSVKSGILRIDNNGYNASGSGSNRVHWNALMLVEGELEMPWSPHPDEVYNGSTVIDATGLTVNNGAIKVKNKAGNTVLSGDSNGNLTLSGTIKSEAGNGLYAALNSGGITFRDSQKSEEVLRIGTSFSNGNRDINGVTFAMPQYSDRISFRHIAKPSLENGWNGSETTYTFMEMWSNDYNHSNGKNYKGVNVFAPMYLSQKIRFRNGGDQYLHEVTPNITWNNMEKLMGVYGDNGTVIGYKSADNLHSRIVVTEANHPNTGDSIRSWGNWNCTGATVHNATFNGRHVNSYTNTETRTICNTAAVMTEGNQVRVNFENVQIKDGKAILSIPKRYRGINEGYTIASIVKKGRGDVWVSEEEEERFIIEAENDIKINIEVIIKLTEAVVARTLKHEDSICYEVPNEQPEGDCC